MCWFSLHNNLSTFEVVVTPEAQAGIREAFLCIHEGSPLNAARWLQGLTDEIDSLERFPERCSYARELLDALQEGGVGLRAGRLNFLGLFLSYQMTGVYIKASRLGY